jgi:GMP synthase (glutamine-hydrolysing)
MDTILVFDYGSQTTQLISRRIREFGVYSEIVPGDMRVADLEMERVKGIILSGSPSSVYEEDAPAVDPEVYESGVPVLGICYGFQRMTKDFTGEVKGLAKTEYGRSSVVYTNQSDLFAGIPEGFVSWMSHGDSVERLGDGFVLLAESQHHIAAAIHPQKNLYGIQFHPEVTHCEYGMQVLENFSLRICAARKQWSMEAYLDQVSTEIRERVAETEVLLLISGGVDSTVTGGILLSALEPSQVHLMYIDTGLMRKNESVEVVHSLKEMGAANLHIIDAGERFLAALQGVPDPEEKRRIIGDMFVRVQEKEIRSTLKDRYFLAQGTLYTDMIESGKGVGKKAKVIKSHHNVRSPLIEGLRDRGLIIEPLSMLYKDEVRILGRTLGISDTVIGRHPFPGPGLAVRILGEVTERRCEILREADHIFVSELRERDLYEKIWQAFCVLLPIQSVGVTGDSRKYGSVCALRAITSEDGMTADVYPFEGNDLLEISALITNSIPEIGRVVYDISSKPPATIEWE